ncbi:sensor histidine kinase [Marinicella sp. W31]|uniref:sensor histidine kinase n=1 Tax=Marinicella sp. W31 TaxID=3023713 RepID=UPI003757AF43
MSTKSATTRNLASVEMRNLHYLNLFRLFIGLFYIFLVHNRLKEIFPVDYLHPQALTVSIAYLFFSVIIIAVSWASEYKTATKISRACLVVDLLVMIYMTYAVNGINQALGILPILSIGSAAILYHRPQNIIMAPILASLLLWFVPIFLAIPAEFHASQPTLLLHALGYFAIALLGIRQSISYRTTVSLTQSQKQTISGLESLNQFVLDKMRSGVIVYQDDHVIVQTNSMAQKLLDLKDQIFLPPELIELIDENPEGAVYISENGGEYFLNQVKLDSPSFLNVLILEDSKLLKNTAQQMNLASLGKLSSSIAHEIRNPLSAIRTASQLLAESENLSKEDVSLSEIISNQTERANNIIEDILQMSKRKQAKQQTVDLTDFLIDFKQRFCVINEIPQHYIDVIVDKKLQIEFDPQHLNQVIWNLSSNVLKHSGQDKMQIVGQSDRIDVKNPGDELTPTVQKELFEPFFTTHNRGTGLGLHLSMELCKANHAQLSYHRINEFNVFRISL